MVMSGKIVRVGNIIEDGKLGGPQVRIAIVAAALKGFIQTTVIMPEENSEAFRERCDTLGVPYRIFPITRITKEWSVALRYILLSFFEIIRLTYFIKQSNFDLVHVSGGSWQYKGVIAGKLAGKKVLWHLNDTSMPGFVRRLFALISRLADGFIFASERSRDYYLPLMKEGKPNFLIPAPVDTKLFDPTEEYPGDKALIAKWSEKLVIGTVANINPVKGLETFIRVASGLKAQADHFQFVVVGPVYRSQQRYFENLREMCDRLSVDNIEFVGGRSDVRTLLNRFDVYVCSSRAESSPISVWEAMSMGKPVISTDVGDVPLYVRDGYNGFIVDVADSAGLAERLENLACDSELRLAFGSRARDTAIRELALDQCAERHIAAYTHILSGR